VIRSCQISLFGAELWGQKVETKTYLTTMGLFILFLFLAACVWAIYRGIKIGRRANKSIEKWLKSEP
jgi:hypothetical protein